ncbi:hypothetical protein [Leuconostoc citreum]
MYVAIGWYSQNKYIKGNTPADVIRELQRQYPNTRNKYTKSGTRHLYPEPLRIVDISGQDKHY